MEEVEQYSQKIKSLMKQYEEIVDSEALYQNNRMKWKQSCMQKEKKLRNLILLMKQEMDQLPSSTAATFNRALKDHQSKINYLSQEFQKKLKAPVKVQSIKKQIPKINDEQDFQTNRTIQSYFKKGDKQMARMKDAVSNMNAELEQAFVLAQNINLQLHRQIQQLDNIRDKVKDTGATLKRADKIVNFFVKAAQCDKCILGLVIAIILCALAFIVLIVKKSGG